MTEPSPARPVPGPPRPGDASVGPREAPEQRQDGAPGTSGAPAADAPTEGQSRRPFDDLEHRPVAEHVTVFEAEHARLNDELSTIDRL